MKRYKRFLKWLNGRARKKERIHFHLVAIESLFWLREKNWNTVIKEIAEKKIEFHMIAINKIKRL